MRSAIVPSLRFYGARVEVMQYSRWHPIAVAIAAGLLAAFLAPVPAQSGPIQYVPTVWQTEQGLPQNTIVDMLQDQDGYLWLATGGGLVRFDGVNFKLFGAEDLPGLITSRVNALYLDRSGVLWIGTGSSGLIRLHDGVSSTYPLPDGMPGKSISSIREDAAGKLWINTRSGIVSFAGDKLQAH